MRNHNQINKVSERLRSTGALINTVGLLVTGAAGVEVPTASATPLRSTGVELAQSNNPEFKRQTVRELKKLRNLFEQIDASHAPHMLYGALEITAHKTITAHGTPDVKDAGVFDTGLIEPGESAVVRDPIFTRWGGHNIVFAYHNDDSGAVPNRPVDIKGVNLAIKYILSGKKPSTQTYLRINHSFGEVRIFDWDKLQSDSTLSYWQYHTSPLKQMGTKPYGDGFLQQAQISEKYPADSRVGEYVAPNEYGTDQFGSHYTARQYLKQYSYHRAPHTPRFYGS